MTSLILVYCSFLFHNLAIVENGISNKTGSWQLFRLLGLDMVLAVACWGYAYIQLLQITMISPGSLLIMITGSWCLLMLKRMVAALASANAWEAAFYRRNLALLGMLVFCCTLATLWMMFYYVGRMYLDYAYYPAWLCLLAGLLSMTKLKNHGLFLLGVAMAQACSVPAFFSSYTLSASQQLFCAPTWYLGILFFVFLAERRRRMCPDTPVISAGFCTGTLFIIFVICLLSAAGKPLFEQSLYITIAIACGCQQAATSLLPRIKAELGADFSWLIMALPPLLGLLCR